MTGPKQQLFDLFVQNSKMEECSENLSGYYFNLILLYYIVNSIWCSKWTHCTFKWDCYMKRRTVYFLLKSH